MATRAQQAKVGIFLIASAVLIVAGILTMQGFNSDPTATYFITFNESVLGLGAGGLVEYLGVPVGTVKNIYVADADTARVEIEVNQTKVTLRQGVTAQLVIVSFATGQMAISLSGGEGGQPLESGTEIPTRFSTIQSFSAQMESVMSDLSAISNSLKTGLAGMQEGQLTRILEELEGTLKDGRAFLESAQKIAESLETGADDAVTEFTELAKELRGVAESADDFLKLASEKLTPLDVEKSQEDLGRALENFVEISEKLNAAIDKLETMADAMLYETDNIEYSIREGMGAMTETFESIRELTETLNEDPSAILRGRGEPRQR